MNYLLHASLRNGTAVVILCIMVLAGGLWSYSKLKVTEFPEIEVHDVVVHASYSATGEARVMQEVTIPIERQLLRLPGFDNVESKTTDDGAGLIISYPFTKDMKEAVREVSDAINAITLPDSVSVSVNQAFFDMEPVFAAAIVSDRTADEIRDMFQQTIIPRLERIPGAGTVDAVGIGSEEERFRFNGHPSYALEVFQARDANTVELARQAAELLKSYAGPNGFNVHVLSDKGEQAQRSVDTMLQEGLYGALFTILIIFLFLRNVRATLIAILSLPLSIMAAMILLDYWDYTLNIMTLGALAVSVGRIVDDSIVAIENIYRWRVSQGTSLSPLEATMKAIREVVGAIASSTLVAVVVFVPLGLVGGLVGEMFRPFALTAAAALLSSLVVSVAVIPLFSRLLNKVRPSNNTEPKSIRLYEQFLHACLLRRGAVLSAAILLTGGTLLLVPFIGVSFLPNADATAFRATVTLPSPSTMDDTATVADSISEQLTEWPEVPFHTTYIGTATDPESAEYGLPQPEVAQISIRVKPGTHPDRFLDRLHTELTSYIEQASPGAQIGIREDIDFGPPTGENITVSLFTENSKELQEASRQVEQYMLEHNDLKNVGISTSRLNGRTNVAVTADIRENKEILAEVESDLRELPIPSGVELVLGGGGEDVEEGFDDLFVAMGVSVGLIFVLLSITFGGVLTPIIVLSSLVFVPSGVLIALYLTGQSLSISALVGMLMLLGIVTTNAIVLLDRIESNRRAGMELESAIIEGARTRLRPILMTACATICGLLPLALADTGGLISRGLATTVIGGMVTSTLLTLIVVPILYAMLGKYRRRTDSLPLS